MNSSHLFLTIPILGENDDIKKKFHKEQFKASRLFEILKSS